MTIRMGYWDCITCGQTEIEGPERQCPGCGRPRSDEIEFYTKDDAPVVTDPELIRRAESGADWQCPYCEADNPGGTTACVGCGASTGGDAKHREQKFIPDEPEEPVAEPVRSSSKSPVGIIAGILGALVVIAGVVWFLFFRTSELTVSVEGVTWTKAVQLERLETQRKGAWAGEVPTTRGVRELKRTTKKRKKKVQQGTKKVKVGKKDLGNGMFKDIYEQRPNYVDKMVDETWVEYEIDRWVQGRKLKETSSDGSEPAFPKFMETRRERVKKRTSDMTFALKGSDGKSYSYTLDVKANQSKASQFKVGGEYRAEINTLGGVRSLSPPK